MGWFSKLTGYKVVQKDFIPTVEVSSLPVSRTVVQYDDGEKFFGGFGNTSLVIPDYWTLRARSHELFETNLYARGLIRRLITNEINTGLSLEAMPDESILGLAEDELADWSETVENRFRIWHDSATLCDHREQSNFGALQVTARSEALISGDVLCVIRQDRRTRLPRVQLIGGEAVQTPLDRQRPRGGNQIKHGVEVDKNGRHVAYWILQDDGNFRRLPAMGERSGRRLAWLVYGTDKRLDDVRGKPILSLILQSLKEIDRYRDSAQRKAVVNSMLAMYIKKSEERPGTRPITGGATRRVATETSTPDGVTRNYHTAEQIPGLVLDELQFGEEPHGFQSNGTDERFGDFEEAIIQAVAWANEIPPEILRLSFSSNYSASQAAINEFKMYLERVRADFGASFCQPIYLEWLISETLAGRVRAPGFLESWRDRRRYDEFGAWMASDWSGHIKPAVDMSKLVNGYEQLVMNGFISRSKATRELTGTKYSKNIEKLRVENEQLASVQQAGIDPAMAAGGFGELAPVEDDIDDDDTADEAEG